MRKLRHGAADRTGDDPVSGPRISDHALVRFLDRGADLDVEQLRTHLAASLGRAHAAARSITASDYLIRADGMLFVVRGDLVTTVLEDTGIGAAAGALKGPGN